MASDVVLDDTRGDWVSVMASVLNVAGSDLILDSPARRGGAPGSFRRALVHGDGDQLLINFGGDYSGGVHVTDARINVHVETQGPRPSLPEQGQAGDLLVIRNETRIEGGPVVGESVTLWLCVGHTGALSLTGAATWLPVTTGTPVTGDA